MSSKKKSTSEQKENTNDYEKILACRTNPPRPPEYYVKLRDKAYKDSQWISAEKLQENSVSAAMLTRFTKSQHDYPTAPPYYDPQYDIIDRIICKKDRKYFVKWMGLGYEQATWEKTVSNEALEDFNLRQNQIHPLKEGDINKLPTINIQRLDSYAFGEYHLESYQLAALNLLLNNFSKMKKTDIVDRYNSELYISCAAFFDYILKSSLNSENVQTTSTTRSRRSRAQKVDENEMLEGENSGEFGPILIVAPFQSTLKWYNAFRNIPNSTTLNYTGIKEGRQVAVDYDFYHKEDKLKFHVLVTTPRILSNNMKTLSEVRWRIAIFDVFNSIQSELSKDLQNFTIGYQIALMQGHPNYTALKKITDLFIDSCTNPYINEDAKKAAQTVRTQIQPKVVMKRKNQSNYDEEKESFTTFYVDCPLSETQRKILKDIIRKSAKYVQKKNFIPLCQRILRICTHPFLLYSQEFSREGVDFITSSTKLTILKELFIDERKSSTNRILIMSDFSLMLDMIEDMANILEIKNERVLSQSKDVQHENPTVFLYNPKYCSISPSLFKTMTTIIVVDGEGEELRELLQTNKPPNLHKIYKLHCRDCSEDTLTRLCILNNVNFDEIQPKQFESICKLAALAAYSDKKVPEPKNIIKKATSIMNSFNPNDILETEFENCDFWSYLVDEENQREFKEESEYEFEDGHNWTARERDQVVRGLCRFGFNRWKKMKIQTGLKVNIPNIISASRALAREMIRIIGSTSGHAVTREFIKEKSMKEEDKINDEEFIQNSCFSDTEFKANLTNNVFSYLREIENIHFLGESFKGSEELDQMDVYEISVPHPSGQLPKWWLDTYDQYLVYGTWKYGLGCYDQFVEDKNQDILKIFGPSDDPIKQKDLTDRAMKLAEQIKRKQSVGQRSETSEKSSSKKDNAAYQPPSSGQNNTSDNEISSSSTQSSNTSNYTISSRRKAESNSSFDDSSYSTESKTRMKNDYKSEIYQFLIRWGVPEDKWGNPDYEAFARDSGLNKYSQYLDVDDVKDLVEDYLNKCNIPQEQGGNPPNTSNKINQRCLAMKQLREILRNEELAPRIFEHAPRWRQLPKEWTPQIEYLYFKEILQIGLVNDTYENILKGSEFGNIHEEAPPPKFIYETSKVMKRIGVIHNSMLEGLKDNSLSKPDNFKDDSITKTTTTSTASKIKKPVQTNKSSSSSKKNKKVPIPNGYTIQSNRSLFPADRAIFDGRVIYPLNLGDNQIILNLGNIIPEREDFYTERYIYPVGYKVSNRLPSVEEKNVKTQWICEIVAKSDENDDNDPNPNYLDQSYKLSFRAWMANNPLKVYEEQTPNALWATISKDISEINDGEKVSISGIDAFLLSNQAVTYLIQKMKGKKRCHNYKAKTVKLPLFAQKMRDWNQNLGVPFSLAAMNEPSIEASKSKPPKKKASKEKDETDESEQPYEEDGNENADDTEQEEGNEEKENDEKADEIEEEEEEEEEEEKKENKKKKQTKPTQKSSQQTTKTTADTTTSQTTSPKASNKSNSSSKKQTKSGKQNNQQSSIQMKPLQLAPQQMTNNVMQNPTMIPKVPPQFAMPPQNFMPYNNQIMMQNPQQTKNMPPNFFMQNNVQLGQMVQNNMQQGYVQPPGFIPTPQMQNFIQQQGVMQVQHQQPPPDSNVSDSKSVSNQ